MENNLTDEVLVEELLRRLKDKDKAYHDLVILTKKLESLNARLLDSEKVKSHFLSNIRNEINNPLTSVLTMCELILADGAAPGVESLKTAVSTIYREAFTLNFQLGNIFAAAELEAGEAVPSISNLKVQSLIKCTIESFRHKALEKGVTIGAAFPGLGEEEPFRTDCEKLERVFSNLLSNAIEFSTRGGSIEVKAWKEEGRLFIAVTDHGIGIAGEDQAAIFERFRQLDAGAAKLHGGHGLGLSIAKAALEMLGGRLSVTSARGAGSTFTVAVPEAAEEGSTGMTSVDANEFFFDGNGQNERF